MQLEKLVHKIFSGKTLPKRVLFRVDAANKPGLSFGHLCRCLTLAGQLKELTNCKIKFLMRNYKEGLQFAKQYFSDIEAIDADIKKRGYLKKFENTLLNFRPQYLVVDLPEEDPSLLFDLARKNRIRSVCLDDMGRYSFRADTIVNGNVLAKRINYKKSLGSSQFLLGDRYFIMRNYSDIRLPKKIFFTVLITFGGSDVRALTKKVLCEINKITLPSVIFKTLLGPGFKNKKSILGLTKNNKRLFIFDCPRDIRKFMLECDLAICSGGITLHELLRLNKPCIAIASNKFEEKVIRQFCREGLTCFGLKGWNSKIFQEKFSQCLSRLLKPK